MSRDAARMLLDRLRCLDGAVCGRVTNGSRLQAVLTDRAGMGEATGTVFDTPPICGGGACGSPGPLVKICGLTRAEDVEAVNEVLPDLCGFVVDVPRSRRNVPAAELSALSAQVDPRIVRVGVFVDEPADIVARLVVDGVVDAVQLHGNEDEAYIALLRGLVSAARATNGRDEAAMRSSRDDQVARDDAACLADHGDDDLLVIQALRVDGPADLERARASAADLVLLDHGAGGTGRAFDWGLLAMFDRPFVLAGGIGPGNAAHALRQTGALGVDMSSGVERDGVKDKELICAAVRAVRAYCEQEEAK